MKRLAEADINTPEHFDKIWQLEGIHRFDAVRMRAFTDMVGEFDTVLDVGSGCSGWAEYLVTESGRKFLDAYAVDFSPFAVEALKQRCPRIHCYRLDALKLPAVWNGKFDVVGAGELIEHMESPAALVVNLARVTRIGGLFIIGTVDPDCPDAVRHGVYPEHLWQISPDELVDLARPYGSATYKRVGNYDFVYTRRLAE